MDNKVAPPFNETDGRYVAWQSHILVTPGETIGNFGLGAAIYYPLATYRRDEDVLNELYLLYSSLTVAKRFFANKRVDSPVSYIHTESTL